MLVAQGQTYVMCFCISACSSDLEELLKSTMDLSEELHSVLCGVPLLFFGFSFVRCYCSWSNHFQGVRHFVTMVTLKTTIL